MNTAYTCTLMSFTIMSCLSAMEQNNFTHKKQDLHPQEKKLLQALKEGEQKILQNQRIIQAHAAPLEKKILVSLLNQHMQNLLQQHEHYQQNNVYLEGVITILRQLTTVIFIASVFMVYYKSS